MSGLMLLRDILVLRPTPQISTYLQKIGRYSQLQTNINQLKWALLSRSKTSSQDKHCFIIEYRTFIFYLESIVLNQKNRTFRSPPPNRRCLLSTLIRMAVVRTICANAKHTVEVVIHGKWLHWHSHANMKPICLKRLEFSFSYSNSNP